MKISRALNRDSRHQILLIFGLRSGLRVIGKGARSHFLVMQKIDRVDMSRSRATFLSILKMELNLKVGLKSKDGLEVRTLDLCFRRADLHGGCTRIANLHKGNLVEHN